LARRLPDLEKPKVRWVHADVATAELAPHFHGADAVIHLAWAIQPSHDEEVMERTNVLGSRRVFEAIADARVSSLIYASSVGAYGPGPKDRRVDESWPTDGIPTPLTHGTRSRSSGCSTSSKPRRPRCALCGCALA
jgi:nucleoside-diphosphate-sugar epimerase